MKQSFIMVIILLMGCIDDKNTPQHPPEVIGDIPKINTATLDGIPFSGVVEAYPCKNETSIYYGNYRGESLMPFAATYIMEKGHVEKYLTPMRLPSDTYNILFWGVNSEPQYDKPAVESPPIRIGADLTQNIMSLRAIFGDTTYRPVYDYCYAVKSVDVGSQNISLDLHRAVAGLSLTVKNSDGSPIPTSVIKIEGVVGGIARSINFFTAMPSDYTRAIAFPLTISENRTSAIINRVMLFPAKVPSVVTITLHFVNGSTKTYIHTLPSVLSAGTILTHTIELS